MSRFERVDCLGKDRKRSSTDSPPMISRVMFFALLVALPGGISVAQVTPGARDHLGLAYDTARDRVVLMGGNDVDADGAYIWNPTTWEWDGEIWTQVDEATPGSISSMGMIFDPGSGLVLSTGGFHPEKGDLDETWLWNGNDWELHEESTPGIRMSSGLAFDPIRQEVVLFSGCVGRNYPSDTWTFKNQIWTRVAEDGPPGVCRPGMFFDQVRERIVLFGGALESGLRSDAMWEWNGEAWSTVDQGEVRPEGRANMSIAYDERRLRAVLYGGATEEGVSEELWEWDGHRWHAVPKGALWPGPREVYGLVYHAGLEAVLLYGGRTAFATPKGDFWSWDGERWKQLH